MNQNNNAFTPFAQAKKPPVRRQMSFVEALKSIGGQTVSSIKNDVVKSTAADFMGSFVGGKTANPNQENNPNNPQYTEWLRQREAQIQQEAARRQRHKEVISTPVYDRREEEVKTKIKALQDELKAIAKEMAKLSTTVQKAVEEEIVSPGVYHLNFLEKIRQILATLRKQVSESNTWLEMSYQRKQSQNKYWGGVKKSGTKFMLSHERRMATQSG